MSSDRTQYKQVVAGTIGDLRSLAQSNPLAQNGCVAQESQRFVTFGLSAASAANANFSVARVDRPVKILEVRLCPSAAVTAVGNTTFTYGYTNDGGGAFVAMGSINTNQNAALGTGNLSQWVSKVITANLAVSTVVPAVSQIVIQQATNGAGESIPVGSAFQVLWEEV